MVGLMIDGVEITPLKQIQGESGSVFHVLKAIEPEFKQFGEAYFSTVNHMAIKGWKRHRVMYSNLVVPEGRVRFVLYDDRTESATFGQKLEIELGPSHYYRLSIPPMVWFAFQGKSSGLNLILNIASIQHDPEECDLLPLETNKIPRINWY